MNLFKSVCLGLAALAFIGCNTSNTKKEVKRPNILIIQPDQHRADIMGCAGNTMVKTPNLDKLAAGGVRFSKAVSAAPVCCPFRATMQTGLYIHEHGVVDNGIHLKEEFKGLAEFFVENGYDTGYIGKWHLGGFHPKEPVGGYIEEGEPRQGWQEWFGYETQHEFLDVWKFNEEGLKVPVDGYDWEPTWHTDMAMDFIKRKTDDDKPWCYYISYGPPHLPEQSLPVFLDQYDPKCFELSPDVEASLNDEDKKRLRHKMHVYYSQVTAIDYEIGRIMDGLKSIGADDNTIIVYVSDHGDVLGSHHKEIVDNYNKEGRSLTHTLRTKGKPFSSAFRIPLIISGANSEKDGFVCDALVSSVDLVPTILELAGINKPDYMQGVSMSDWYFKGDGPKQKYVYLGLGDIEGQHIDESNPDQKQAYKEINDMKKPWRAVWDGQYLLSELEYELLYDYNSDPYEMNNLYNCSDYQNKKIELRKVLHQFAEKTGDPIFAKLK